MANTQALRVVTEDSKHCPRCQTVKPVTDFNMRRSGKRTGQALAHCKGCSATTTTERKERDPSTYRRIEWPSKLKRLYGLIVEGYYALLTTQNGGCAICETTDPNVGNREYKKRQRTVFDVDHCHETGRVRGLLCTRCNRLVGLAGDNSNTVCKLLAYLTKEV